MSVRLRHPGLPDDQVIRVEDLAVPHYRASGWDLVPDDEPDPADSAPVPARTPQQAAESAAADPDAPAPTETPAPDPEPAPDKTPRRRATKEADEK